MDELENITNNPETAADILLRNTAPLIDLKVPGITSPLNTTQSLISGNSYTGPNPGSKGEFDPIAYNKAQSDAFELKLASKTDPLKHSRVVSFDSSRFGYNFDRYYNHPKFKDLGFSIYRDNESLYNAKSTWLDDFRRMASQWTGLAGQAFVGTYKGWGRWGDGTDEKDAAIMENSLSIAQSSKEGLGAWFTNFGANSAYTFGIVGSVILEEIALAAIEGGSFGAATPLVGARSAINTSRIGGALSKLVKSLTNVSEAKTFWQGVRGMTTGASNAAVDFINPLRNTTNLLGDLAAGEKTVDRINEFAKIKKTFGAFYRDMRELNLVLSESRLEGGFAKNKIVSDGTAAFIKQYGRMPNQAETKEIYDRAEQAGVRTALTNMPAIYLSNRIVLDTALRGFKPIGRLINPGPGKNPFFKIIRNYDWKKGMAGGPFSMTSAGFKFSDLSLKSLKGTFSRLSKEGLPVLAGKAFRYTSANLAEGLQESFQEVVQGAYTDYYLNDYYAKLYSDPFLASKNSLNAAFDKSIKSQFSKQGLDVFLSGFLMGGGIQPIQNLVMNKGQLVAMRLGKKEKFDQYKADQEAWTKKQVEALNSVAQDPLQYAKWLDQNLMLQRDLSKEYEQAVEEGDEKTANDVQQDSLFHHVHTLLQSGRYDVFMDSLKDLRNLDSKDLADAFENVPIGRNKKKSLNERLDKAIAKAENIKDRFDLINEEYPNPFNYNLIDPKKSPEAYMDELRAYTAFEEAKKHAMFSEYTFGEALKRMDSLVNKAAANNPIGAAAAPDVSLIYSPTQSAAAIETLKTEISALSQGTPEQKKQAKSKEKTLEHLKNLNNLRTKYSMILYLIDKAGKNSADALSKLEEELEALDTKSLKLYDENGKKINFKSASVPVDVKLKAFYMESLKDAYMAYMKNIAKTKNVYPVLEAINQSFVDYLDFLALNADARSRSEDIDALTNPTLLLEYSQRIAAARKVADEQRQVLEAEALEKYRQYATNNKLMQDLLAIGVYFDPESFDEFRDNDVIPDRFIDVRTGREVTAEDPRYAEIIDLINNYEQATGKTFSGKPAAPKPEAPPTPPTSTQAPPPDDKDKKQQPPATTGGKVDISTLPKDTQDQLRAAFEEAKKAGATDFDLWIEESVIAQSIIQGKKPKAPTPQRRRPVKNEITVNNPKSTSGPDSVTAPIYANPAVLSADETGYIFNDPETGKTVNSKRVTSLKRKKVPEEVANSAKGIRSTERGNVLDDITRYFAKPVEKPFETNPDFKTLSLKDDILNAIYRGVGGLERQALRDSIDAIASQLGNKTHKNKKGPDGKPLKYSITMTDSFKDSLVEVLRTMAIELEDYTWNTNLPSLHGVLLDERYAGSVDLLLEKNGEYYIVDLKSSETSRRAQPDIYDEDTIQLNAYADLFEQMTGKPIKGLYIINMIVTSSNDGKVLDDVILDTFVDPKTGEDSILIPFERKPISELLGGTKSDLDKLKEQEQEALDAGDMALAQILRNQIDEMEKTGTPPVAPKPPSAPPPTPPAPAAPAAPVSGKKADVILPIGTSGSGKSTFIKSLPQENLVVISPDEMRVEFTGDINDKSKDKEIYEESAKRAIQAIKDGKQVVFDTTNLTKEKRRPFIEAIKKAIPGANIQYKLMELNPELAKQRIKAQIARGENRANVSDETIDRHAESYKQMLEDIKSEDITPYNAELAALDQSTTPVSNEKRTIQMQPANVEKIKAGTKTTTTRSESQAKQINIPVGQSAIVNFGGQDFKVTNRGLLTIEEAGGKEAIVKSEGVKSESDFMYQQTKDWVNGKGKLYVYDIVPLDQSTTPVSEVKELKDAIVDRLRSGETITGTISRPEKAITAFEFSETGKPTVKFYNRGAQPVDPINDINKKATLKLVETVTTEDGREFKDVVEVYIGDKYVGNIQENDPKQPAKTKEVIAKAEPIVKEQEGKSSADTDVVSKILKNDDFLKRMRNKLDDQTNVRATAEQVRLAKEWYENSPLSKFIPFSVAFNVVNTKTRGSIATWDQHGITLFKGSDYSDLYHEAWHGFTQTFLTKEQRDNLYAEARKNKGTFRSYKGREVAYENATREELEEKLAEDFREFMLSKGKKVNEKAPVKNKIFKLLLDILNYLFGKSNVQDIQDNSMGNPVISEMFEKLRVGDLSQYTFNQANAEFTLLNSTIEPLDPLMDSPGTISRQDAKELVDSVDSLIGELIDKLNDANDTKVFTRSLLLDKEGRTLAYKYVEEQLTNKLEELLVEHNSMAPDADRQEIDYKISLLSYALRNYGDSNNPFNTFGLVKYHGQTSEFLEFEDRLGDTPEDINLYERNEFDRKSGNETAMKALAGTSLLYTIRSLYAHDAEGNVQKNLLGFPKLADFNRSWNRITNITEGSNNVDDIYKKLQDASEDYPIVKQFLNKIGSPSNLENSSVRLWSDIEKIMTMPRIGLVSLRVKVENSKPEGSNKVKKTVVLTATQSTGEYTKVGRKWDSEFAVATGPYISVNANNVNTLNVDKVLADFSTVNFENAFAFMKAIGMPLEESKVAKKGFMESGMLVEVREAHTKLAAIQNYHNSYSPTNRITITKPSEIFKDTKVKISLNEGVPMSDVIRARKLEQALQGSTTKYNAIQKFQLKWSDDFSDTTVSNAENENQYERSLRSTASQMVTKLNAANTETELTQDGVANADDLSMNHLSRRRNPFMKTSMFFNRLFDKKTGEKNSTVVKKTNKLTNARIELMNMSGVSRELTSVKGTIENSGISSSSADGVTKRLEDIYMMMLYGVNEATRHADKSTTYLYKVISADGKVHLIDIASFSETIGENSSVGVKAFVNQLTEYLGSEHERIRKLENGDPAGSVTVGKSSYYEVGSKLAIFDKILSTQTKAILDNVPGSVETAEQFQDYLNEEKNIDLKNAIEKEIAQYLFDKANTITEKLNSVKFFENEQLVDELVKRMVKTKQAGYDKTESIFSISSERKKEIVNSIAIAYAANDWLHKYESTLLFYGDPALYDHSKDEFFKRNAGFSATGDIPRTDKSMIEYINAKLRENSFASKLGITPKAFGKTMSAAVMQDTATRSVYLDEYLSYAKEKEEERLRDLGASDEKIKEVLDKLEEIFNDAYASMKEGDGQGWINFDAYRSLLLSLNKWSHYQEQLYQKVINNESVDVEELLQFFPVKKMQYWGPLKTDGLAVYGFHKYSLMPLIPNITAGTHMETLQRKMLEQGVDYAMFQSGSKINTITTNGKVDKFYNDNSNKEDMSVAFADPGYTFTKNNIFLDYFKDQLEVNDSYKPSVTFPTQLRSLIEEGLMENGVPTDWEPKIKDRAERIKAWNKETDKETSYNYRLLTAYESKLERLVELKKEKLRKEIGSNPEDLVKFIKRELTRKEMAEHSIDFIDYDAQKNKFKNSLDLSLMADSIERGLVAIVQKNIINQKVNGQSLVQVAGTGFEKANFRKPSKEEAKKYGQRGLRSYTNEPIDFDQKYKDYTKEDLKNEYDQLSGVEIKYWAEGYRQAHRAELQYLSDILAGKKPTVTKVRNPKTESMQVKIAMQGKFKTLLQTTEVKNLAREENIAPIDALNLLIKDETWRRNNRDLITSVAVRIPTQGLNSMEFMEIVEFLPESSGNIIILPAEIVGKTGGDFDIDKMYSLFPNLKLRTKDDISTVEFETGDTIEGIENDILSITREILEKEDNFLALITPNTTITLKNIAEKISEKLKGKKQKRSATDIFESEVNLEKHQSNNIGKMILGIIAVNNTFSTIFNRTGLILEPQRVVTATEKEDIYGRQELELPHNKVDGKISLSNLYSADGIDKIADLISQMINGSVDVAKDDWIFDLQADKEAISKIVFMIQAGVPAKQVALFMSQPIIREYIKKQKMLRSKFNEPLGIKDPGTYYRITARDEVLFEKEFGFGLDKKEYRDPKTGMTAKYMLWPTIVDFVMGTDKQLFSEQSLEKNINSKEYTDVDRAVFMHYLEIEEMANGVTQLTQNLNFDTSKTTTLFEARTKLDKLNDLANGISQESIDMIIKNSPKGKFKIQDFVINLLKGIFPLRDGQKLNDHINEALLSRDKGFRTKISSLKKRLGIQSDEDVINKYRSDLIAFIFQQDYYKFDPNAKTYNGADVAYDVKEVASLTNGAFVKDGVLYVDKDKIKEIFTSKKYKTNQAWGYAVAPIDPIVLSMYEKSYKDEKNETKLDSTVAEALYFKYTYQREINRSIESNSFENISKTKEFFEYKKEFEDDANADFKAYESVLRDITLDGLNFHGHMFFGKRAYAKQIMAIKETNPELFDKYQFLSDLEIVTTKYGDTEISNLRVAGRPKGKDIERLYDNLQELSDASVKKVKDSFKNAQLSALFQKMTHFALLQSGIDTASTFSLIPFVSNESYLNLVKEPYEKFLADPGTESLDLYSQLFEEQYSEMNNKALKVKVKAYAKSITGISPYSRYESLYTDVDAPDMGTELPVEESKSTTQTLVSDAYGVVVAETNPSPNKTQEFINIIQPQIKKQAYKENASGTANDMFMYGLRWTRKSTAKAPLNNKSYANNGLPITDAKAKDGYVYDTVDQNGNQLAPISDLQPIIEEIQKTLGIDMSNYDAVIGNIYLPGQNIATHRDTTESLSARNYPVIVYTIGNNSGIGIYEDKNNPGSPSFASNSRKEIPTQNGTIYTFGMDGKGRFELAHDTPKGVKRDQKFPPITLPNGTVVENYTITLTFRRAADLELGIPKAPNKLFTQVLTTPTETSKSTGTISLGDSIKVEKDTLTNTILFNLDPKDLTENNAKEFANALAQTGKKQLVVFNEIEGRTKNVQGNNSVYRVMGSYAYGIVTKKGIMPTTPAGKQSKTLMFTDATLDDNKKMIDDMINELVGKQAEGYELLFDDKGYGQYMAGYNEYFPFKTKADFEASAPETFNYLSQQLFEKFGYINPNYLKTLEGRRIVQSRQPVTDDEIFDLKKSCKLA